MTRPSSVGTGGGLPEDQEARPAAPADRLALVTGSELAPDSPPHPASVVQAILWPAMRRAALRSCLKLAEASGKGRSADELASQLLPLAESIWCTANGGSHSPAVPSKALPAGLLLESLRRDMLEELALLGPRVSSAETIAVLKAVDIVRDQVDSDPSHRFISRFLGAAGLDALVEVAHDMRSPLASIVLLVETIRQQQSGSINEIQERQLALVYGAAFGLNLLANDVIELARGGDRLFEPERLPLSVWDVMQSAREIVLPIAAEKGIELRMHPPSADWRMGHPSALHRVLLNLTTNALKFTNEGFVEVRAREITRTLIEFSVRDTGRGIPAELIPFIFDAFRENDREGGAKFSSSGLGLSISRRLVAVMGGDLKVENVEDGGSRFLFSIEMPQTNRL